MSRSTDDPARSDPPPTAGDADEGTGPSGMPADPRVAEPGITAERLADAFLEPPLYSTSHAGGFGTISTAAHFPDEGRVQYRWPGVVWDQSLEHFEERTHAQAFAEGEVVR